MSEQRYNPGLHAVAVSLMLVTFPLIFIGGLVTSKGAGMSVPDWPNSYGYNMFLFPPGKWVGNIWYEHVHRLAGSLAGLVAIVLCLWAWVTDRRPHIRWLATGVLLAIIVQGVLGGERVVLARLGLAIIHGCFAQAVFCLEACLVIATSNWWADAPNLSQSRESAAGRWLARLAVAAVAIVYCQLIVGALMRHHQAGLAIPDFPLAFGKVVPPTTDADLQRVSLQPLISGNSQDIGNLDYCRPGSLYYRWMKLWPGQTLQSENALWKVWLAFGHRVGASVVSLTLLILVYKVLRLNRGRPSLVGLAMLLAALLLAQLTLGALTVLRRKPADVASAHVAVGALVLVTTLTLAARAMRLYRPRPAETAVNRKGFDVVRLSAGLRTT